MKYTISGNLSDVGRMYEVYDEDGSTVFCAASKRDARKWVEDRSGEIAEPEALPEAAPVEDTSDADALFDEESDNAVETT